MQLVIQLCRKMGSKIVMILVFLPLYLSFLGKNNGFGYYCVFLADIIYETNYCKKRVSQYPCKRESQQCYVIKRENHSWIYKIIFAEKEMTRAIFENKLFLAKKVLKCVQPERWSIFPAILTCNGCVSHYRIEINLPFYTVWRVP